MGEMTRNGPGTVMVRVFDKWLLVGLGLILLLLVGSGTLNFWNTNRLNEDAASVVHTQEVLDLTNEVLRTLVDAETGERGFLISGKEEYLQPYEAATKRLDGLITTLQQKTSDNPTQQERIDELKKLAAQRMNRLKEAIALRRTNVEKAQAFVASGKGKGHMDAIRELLSAIDGAERDLLQMRQRQSRHAYATAQASAVLSTLLGLLMVGAFFWLLHRSLLTRQQAAAVLHEQREWFRTTLSSIGDGVIATDAKGRVTFLNPVAQSLTGWNEDEAKGKTLERVFRIENEKTRQPVENPALRALKEGTVVGLANHTILIARDGTERAIDDSAAPIGNERGHVVGVVLVFRDVTEQRKAQRRARFLASIVESSNDAIIGKDVNGVIDSWNKGAERIFGYSAAEAIGRPIAMLAVPDRADEMPGILDRIKRGEQVEHFDTVRRAKDGRLVPISLTVSPIKDEDGEIIGASKIARDISERKRAEEALHEEKERLHATLTGIGDAVIVTDSEGLVTLMNPVAQSLTGWNEEATGRPLEEVFHIINEQTRHPVESPVRQVIRDGTIVGLANHTVLVAKDGTERPVEDSAAPVRRQHGEVVGVVLVFRDATERRAAEAAAHKNQEIFKLVHSIAKIGHWEWNSQTDENKWSPEIEALYGLEPGAFEGTYQAWAKLLHPDDLAKAEEDVRRALESDKYFTEFRVVWPDGSVHWLEARANVFKDRHGKPERIMGVNMDVTEWKRIEEDLTEADRRKDEFLATLAHELRNPLAPIRNVVELLRQAGDDPVVTAEGRNIMERQLGHMVRLIDDLMDISRVTSGKLRLRRERVELAAAVQSAVEETRPIIEASGHELTVTPPEEAVVLNADPTRLAQIFSNLLNNAAKYMEKGGHIWLTAERADGEVVVSVRDMGIGIDAEHLPHIFEMFSQATSALGRSEGGLGIGLALVRGLVELHEGTIEARSNGAGMGSEFIVRLPVLDIQIPKLREGSDDGHEKPRSGVKHRILVVDDNADSAISLAMILRRLGHEIQTAHDGLEAVQAAAAFRPHVILLDIGLPKMNGYEAAKRIREQLWEQKVAIIAVSGWGQEKDKQKALEAGFDHHLTKPVEPGALSRLLALITPS